VETIGCRSRVTADWMCVNQGDKHAKQTQDSKADESAGSAAGGVC
jgi:hypothetical protein